MVLLGILIPIFMRQKVPQAIPQEALEA
jgi:hypothetical protein